MGIKSFPVPSSVQAPEQILSFNFYAMYKAVRPSARGADRGQGCAMAPGHRSLARSPSRCLPVPDPQVSNCGKQLMSGLMKSSQWVTISICK